MQIEQIAINKLKLAKYNPRKITDTAMNGLIKSIQIFGIPQPIIVNKDMTVIGGHQRVKACGELGYEQVPCIVLDVDKQKEKAMNISLNNKHIEGEFTDVLQELLKDLKLDFPSYEDLQLDKLENIVGDINNGDENSEWAKMDNVEDFHEGDDWYKINYCFETPEKRDAFIIENNLEIKYKRNEKNWIIYK